MKDALNAFVGQRLPIPGLVAWSARLPDRTLASQCLADWLKTSQVEQVLSRMALAADNLNFHRLQPLRLCWTFENLRIHLAFGRDGACLACFVENRPGPMAPGLEDLLRDFRHSNLDSTP